MFEKVGSEMTLALLVLTLFSLFPTYQGDLRVFSPQSSFGIPSFHPSCVRNNFTGHTRFLFPTDAFVSHWSRNNGSDFPSTHNETMVSNTCVVLFIRKPDPRTNVTLRRLDICRIVPQENCRDKLCVGTQVKSGKLQHFFVLLCAA